MSDEPFVCVRCKKESDKPEIEHEGTTAYVICPACGYRLSDEEYGHERLKQPPTPS